MPALLRRRDGLPIPDPGPPAARRLLRQARREADFPETHAQACAVWLDDGEEQLPAVLVEWRPPPPARWGGGVYLLDAGGRILDDLEFSGARVGFIVNSRNDPKLRELRCLARADPGTHPFVVLRRGVPVPFSPGAFTVRLRRGALEAEADAQ